MKFSEFKLFYSKYVTIIESVLGANIDACLRAGSSGEYWDEGISIEWAGAAW